MLELSRSPDYNQRSCRGVDANIFVPVDSPSERVNDERLQRARAYCNECPIRDLCLAHAKVNLDVVGIYGGERFRIPRYNR